MKTKAVGEDEDEPRKMRSSRSKRRRHTRRASSTESESPPRKRSKKPSKRTPADKKSKRSKVSSRRRRRSPSPSPSLSSSSSSPSSASRSCSTCSSTPSERSMSPLPPRSRSRDVKKRKGRGRDRERRKARRSTSASTSTSSRSGSRSRNKSSKRWTKDGDKMGKDYKNFTDSFNRDEEALVAAKKGRDYGTERHEQNVSLEKTENPPSKSADETEVVLPAADGVSPVAVDLELILRQKALENFIKFRAAAAMAGKTDNGAALKETLTDGPQNAATKVTEARSASITPFRRQASSLGVRHPTESPKSEDRGNGTSPWMRNSSTGMSHEVGSHSRILKDGDSGGPTQHEGSMNKATHSSSQHRTPQDGRNSRSVTQRLAHTPGSASSVTRRLGSSVGVSHMNAAPRIRSVVSIPGREELDGGSSSTPQMPCENPAPVENSNDVRYTPIDIGTKAEGTSEDGRKTSQPSASNGSILSSADGKAQVTEPVIEDTEGSQLQKKTFSRMHDGETVEVSYKVYIPKKTPALARRKLQR